MPAPNDSASLLDDVEARATWPARAETRRRAGGDRRSAGWLAAVPPARAHDRQVRASPRGPAVPRAAATDRTARRDRPGLCQPLAPLEQVQPIGRPARAAPAGGVAAASGCRLAHSPAQRTPRARRRPRSGTPPPRSSSGPASGARRAPGAPRSGRGRGADRPLTSSSRPRTPRSRSKLRIGKRLRDPQSLKSDLRQMRRTARGPASSARSATSTESRASQRAASCSVSTPIEQPISNAELYRLAGSAATVTAYFSASYALVAKLHGSGASA